MSVLENYVTLPLVRPSDLWTIILILRDLTGSAFAKSHATPGTCVVVWTAYGTSLVWSAPCYVSNETERCSIRAATWAIGRAQTPQTTIGLDNVAKALRKVVEPPESHKDLQTRCEMNGISLCCSTQPRVGRTVGVVARQLYPQRATLTSRLCRRLSICIARVLYTREGEA